jgi:hypothetical protein
MYGPVYHGTRVKGLRNFDPEYEGSGTVSLGIPRKGYYGGAFFFTSNRENALYYTDPAEGESDDDYVVTAYLEIKNPLVVDKPEKTPRHYIEQAKTLSASFGEDDLSVYGEEGKWYYLVSNDDIGSVGELNGGPFRTEEEAESAGRGAMEQHSKSASSEAYDGVILKDMLDGVYFSDIYIVFSPEQIHVQ